VKPLNWALEQVIYEENQFQLSILFCASNNNSTQFSSIFLWSILPFFIIICNNVQFFIFSDVQLQNEVLPRTDTHFLTKFIRTKDYNLRDAALESVKKYYSFILRNLKALTGLRPSDIDIAFRSNMLFFLKNKLEGSRIVVWRMKNWCSKEFPLKESNRRTMSLMEHYTTEAEIQENGIYVICDLQGFRLEHLRALCSPMELRTVVQIVLVGKI